MQWWGIIEGESSTRARKAFHRRMDDRIDAFNGPQNSIREGLLTVLMPSPK
jgi:hypothetical protein